MQSFIRISQNKAIEDPKIGKSYLWQSKQLENNIKFK